MPESVEIENNGVKMRGHPALQFIPAGDDSDERIALKLFASPQRAQHEMRKGVIALYKRVLHEEVKYLSRKLPGIDTLTLRFTPFGNKKMLIDDIIDTAISHTFVDDKPFPRQREEFLKQLADKRGQLVSVASDICGQLEQAFELYRQVARRIDGNLPLSWVEAVSDIKDQVSRLIYPGFVHATGVERLPRLQMYFKAISRRLDAIDQAPDKDRKRRSELLPVWERFKLLPQMDDERPDYRDQYHKLRWSFEELRISLFAQEIGTVEKVSVSRLENRLQALAEDS